jgi:hypothetical protein
VSANVELHEQLVPVSFLLGRWTGASVGLWIPGQALEFIDEIEFGHVGKPYLSYSQQTWRDGAASHGERGYLISAGDGTVGWTLAQPSGIVEVLSGSVSGTRIELRTGAITIAAGAKPVTDVERIYEVDGDELTYRLRIAMNDEPLVDHIVGTLHRWRPRPVPAASWRSRPTPLARAAAGRSPSR